MKNDDTVVIETEVTRPLTDQEKAEARRINEIGAVVEDGVLEPEIVEGSK